MIRRLRLLLKENKVLRKGAYPFVRWIVLDVFKFKQRNIKRFGYEAVRLIDDAAKMRM